MRPSALPLIAPLLRQARYEVLPTASAEAAVLDSVPREVTVTVTASPTKGLEPTLALTERLIGHGYRVVPHLSARLVRDRGHLAKVVPRLVTAGVDDVFVPAGDADPPTGEFTSALDLLERLAELGSPFARVGITGYPETHPKIEDDVTVQAMWDKRRHATYIVSNLCLNPATLRRWINRIRRRGVTLPLLLGLAGPVDRTKLMTMAAKIGVADSARFAAGHSGALVKLATPGAYQPERLLARLAHTLADPAAKVEGLHIFTFNQVGQTQAWHQRLLDQAETRPA
jgi:methylenetetrahydrofolate reductase (NADPH)